MTCKDCIHYGICIFHLTGNEWSKCFHFKNKTDVVEVEKVAKILTDVTEKAPCEIVGANEWDYDYCNCAELCSQSNYEQCWVRYFKHCKERSEGDG